MTLNKRIKILIVSDVHLGSKRNSTKKIIENIKTYILNGDNKDLDILFIAGDFFDRLLELNFDSLDDIDFVIHLILSYCSKNNIALRVLEGTPSHDWGQPFRFITLNKIAGFENLDIKYIDNVSVEYFSQFDMSVLYVPDEIQPTPEKTLTLVKDTLSSKGIDKVDIAIMHGQFEYQLPAYIKNIPRHSSEEYLALVRSFIFVGHIHTHSFFQRIVAQGSFDRLSHGEEEPKGYVVAYIGKEDSEFFFIENKGARIYKTIDCSYYDLEKTIEYLKEYSFKLPPDSAIRISANSQHPIFSNMQELVVFAPDITWTKLLKDKDNKEEEKFSPLFQEEEKYTPITITKLNLVQLMEPRIAKVFDDEKFKNRCFELIKDSL